MALAGKLEDVPPAEILHFIAMSEKTGKLTFTTGTEEGLIVFRQGKIIYAASSSLRETFGSIVISMKLVNQEELSEALKLQHRTGEDKRLGRILVEMGVLALSDLQQVLQHQVIHVLREMFGWERGFFKFRNLAIQDHGEVEVDARNLLMEQPLDARRVALDAARRHDEQVRRDTDPEKLRKAKAALTEADEAEIVPPERATLRELMGDVAGPSVTAETVREVFEEATRVFSRGVIFAVHSHGVRGIAQFGLVEGDEPPSQRVRRLWLPVEQPSVVSWAIKMHTPFRGKPERNQWNEMLFEVMGGSWPEEGVAAPILAENTVAMVFYGDNEPHDLPVGSTRALEERLRTIGEGLLKSSDAPKAERSEPEPGA